MTRAQSCANHVQHIERLPRATYRVPRGTEGSPAMKFDRFEISFILAEPLTDEGGKKTGLAGKNTLRRASENATYYCPKIPAPNETPALVAG